MYTDIESLATEDKSLVKHLLEELGNEFKGTLHSVYVSGYQGVEITPKTQIDLVISAILEEPLNIHELEKITKVKDSLMESFHFIKSIDFDLGYINNIIQSTNFNAWAYWLKNESTFVGGKNIQHLLDSFYPQINPEVMVNGEYCAKWQRFCEQLERGLSPIR